MMEGVTWKHVCNDNIDMDNFKTLVTNPTNWRFGPAPEIIGTVAGASEQRELDPNQFSTIFNAAGVGDSFQSQNLKKNVEIRYSDGRFGHAIPTWHLDYDVWNPPRYHIITVSFSEDPHGGTHYLDIPQFNPSSIDQVINPNSPERAIARLEILESIQSLIEELTGQKTPPPWLSHYVKYCQPGTIYRNLTQTHFHKSPPMSKVRVLFVVGVPHSFRDQGPTT